MRAHAHAEATKGSGAGGGTPYDVAVERAVDATLRRATYGALAGGVAALALLRGPRARALIVERYVDPLGQRGIY